MHTSAYTLTQFWWSSCEFPLLNTDQSDAHTAAKHNYDDNECPISYQKHAHISR